MERKAAAEPSPERLEMEGKITAERKEMERKAEADRLDSERKMAAEMDRKIPEMERKLAEVRREGASNDNINKNREKVRQGAPEV